MKNITTFFIIYIGYGYLSFSFSQSTLTNDECMNCHSAVDEIADMYKMDIHFSYNIFCSACHGGDPASDDMEISMSKEKGFIGIPSRKERHLVCIKCHSDQNKMESYGYKKTADQYEKLKSSVHFKPTYNNQGPIADCISCHNIHNITRVTNANSPVYPTRIVSLCGSCHSDPDYMKNYNAGLPVDQVVKYKTSIHGIKNSKGDVYVAECASCHGSHEILAVDNPHSNVYPSNIPKVCASCHSDKTRMAKYKIATDQYDLYLESVHGNALLEKGDLSAPSCNDCHGNHGAVPPGVESISKVCGSCHSLNMELFEQSVHKQAFDIENIPECESCHGNHNIKNAKDEMVGVGEKSTCINCHDKGDNGYLISGKMKTLIDSLKSEEKETKAILEEANKKGMDVSNASFSLKDIRQVLIRTRTTLHSFDQVKFNEEIKPGFEIINEAKKEGVSAIDNYYFRRKGLLVSTFIVTLLVVGLYLKIRKLEKEES